MQTDATQGQHKGSARPRRRLALGARRLSASRPPPQAGGSSGGRAIQLDRAAADGPAGNVARHRRAGARAGRPPPAWSLSSSQGSVPRPPVPSWSPRCRRQSPDKRSHRNPVLLLSWVFWRRCRASDGARPHPRVARCRRRWRPLAGSTTHCPMAATCPRRQASCTTTPCCFAEMCLWRRRPLAGGATRPTTAARRCGQWRPPVGGAFDLLAPRCGRWRLLLLFRSRRRLVAGGATPPMTAALCRC